MDEPMDGLSESIAIQKEDMSIFDEVDDVIGRAVLIGDPLVAFDYGSGLIKNTMVRGLALAKLLYRLKESWPMFVAAGVEDDLETMAFLHMGTRPQTTRKYLDMWESVFENDSIPETTRKLLYGKPIRDLLLLTAAVREGSIDNDALEDIGLGVESARDKVREARGAATSSNTAIRIYVQMQDTAKFPAGVVYAKRGDESVVLFEIDLEADPKSLEGQALARILHASGIQEAYVVY